MHFVKIIPLAFLILFVDVPVVSQVLRYKFIVVDQETRKPMPTKED